MIHEFIYNFINIGSENKIYYFHAICKADGENRPECVILFKIFGKKTKKERKQVWLEIENDLIDTIDQIFNTFIKNGRMRAAYRTDVKPQLLLNSYNDWLEIKEKLKEIK